MKEYQIWKRKAVKMANEKKKKFYKEKSFWACVATGIGGVLAGTAGVADVIGQLLTYIIGG